MKKILVVDDEKNMCAVLKILLENEGYRVITALSGKAAIDCIINGSKIDLIISDLKMPDIDGIELLNYLKQTERNIPLILITAYGTIKGAVEAIKKGAVDFITKPFNKDVICHVIRKIFKIDELEKENVVLKQTIQEKGIIYKSKVMKNILDTVKKVANVNSPVLILGESGTGKELVAKAIHSFSCNVNGKRYYKPFISINCPALPETLFESELFGYKKGAFTGATRDFSGKIKLADGGIIFLDEIADLPLKIQPKLLRLLEQKEIEMLGSTNKIKVDTRIICATNHDLKQLVQKGLFREDLYYRINTITINIPPLRDRPEDIIPLALFFLENFSKEMGKKIKTLSENAKNTLMDYPWPGNIRELRNIIERVVVLSNKEVIRLSDLPVDLQKIGNVDIINHNKIESMERQMLVQALKKNGGNISAAAKNLGISRSTLRYRIKKYCINTG